MTDSFLSDRGRKYARYIFIVHRFCSGIKNKFFRKLATQFILGTMASLVYITILKEGELENDRTRKTKMSGVQRGAGASGERTTGEMREMRISNQGVSTVSPLVQTGSKRRDTNAATEEKI